MTDRKIIEERMAEGFVPSGGNPDLRVAAALEYIAFFLGRIDKNISEIKEHVKTL